MPDVFQSNQHTVEEQVNETSSAQSEKKHKDTSLFHAYCAYPNGVTFAHQEPGEVVLLLLRRHFVTNIPWMMFALLLLLVPLALIVIIQFFSLSLSFLPTRYTIILLLFYYLIIFGYIFLHLVSWFYNVGIITKKRVIDVDFTDVMSRNIAETRIPDIVDAEYNQGGLLHSFLDFGNTFIQTEGVKPNFEFIDIPHPSKVVDLILDLKEASEKN